MTTASAPDATPDGRPAGPRGLERAYHWQGPVIIATALTVTFVVLLARSHVNGWFTVAALVTLVWAGYVASVRYRARAFMAVDGPELTTRRYRRLQRVDGRRVRSVQEYLTSRGPCYRVRTDDDRPVHVPAAWLHAGHSTFFTWLMTWNPEAALDQSSRRTLERLVGRGLVDDDLLPRPREPRA